MIQLELAESYWLDRRARGVVTPPQSPRLRPTPPAGPCKIRVEHPSHLGARKCSGLLLLPFATVQSPLLERAAAGSGASTAQRTHSLKQTIRHAQDAATH